VLTPSGVMRSRRRKLHRKLNQQDTFPTGEELGKLEWLGENICELICNLDQTHLPVLYGLVGKMLADINVLGPLQP
jgi:hypothetical protein